MPYIVQEIIDDNPDLATAQADDPVQSALATMIENDFSQLPIVDEYSKPQGMVTYESIVQALNSFDVGLADLRVGHARVKAYSFRDDSDLFDLLDRLKETNAVLIVDGAGCLKGIVTNYDTTEYFRRRAEDLMLVEDVETLLKDYIQAAYKNEEDEIDEARLTEAVQKITSSGTEQRDRFRRALWNYLNLLDGSGARVDQEALDQVLDTHYKIENQSKQFDELTLDEYIKMLLHKDGWEQYRPVFDLKRDAIRNLLNKVRMTRNALAHFRSEITLTQHRDLRFAAEWFAQYADKINDIFAIQMAPQETIPKETAPETLSPIEEEELEEIVPAEDEAEPGESRYAPLAIWLQSQPPRKNLVKPTFSQIEEIIGGPLPESAYNHRAWWANDSVSHVQSQQWLDVGWRVSSINMTSRVVRFARIRERQKAYIDFYSSLLTELRDQPGFEDINAGPNGASWHLLESLSANDIGLASFTFSFGRGNIFRIELYIDSGDRALNKKLFDALAKEREAIEGALGRELLWQRLDNKRASRIAIIFPDSSITNPQEELDELQRKAIPALIHFKEVMQSRVQEAGKQVV